MTTQLVRSTMKMMVDGGIDPVELIWFDMTGAITDTQKANLDPLMTHRPPFEKCCVVWQGATRSHQSYEVLMLVAGTDPADGIMVSMWKGPSGRMPQKMAPMFYFIEDGNIRYGAVEDTEPVEKEIAELMLAAIAGWYASMDKGVASYAPIPKSSFTNRRKMAAGKMPTFDWKTVFIEPAQPRSEHQGGTHASPRLHDRRGHVRRYKTGKCIWVKPHKVGDATKGAVFHDYAFKVTA